VTITGTNLSGATVVRFNGISAQFTVVSATSITAIAPGGVTTGPVAVTTPGGTAVSPSSYAVVAKPTIASYTISAGASGTTVTITGTNLGGATGVNIGGIVATFSVTSANSITASIPPPGSSANIVTVTTPGGVATSSNGTAAAASSSSGGRCGNGIFNLFGLLLLLGFIAWRRRFVDR
jgi:hypothetical protein